MVEISKLKKLILGTDEDRALANEYILEHELDIVPDSLIQATSDSDYYYEPQAIGARVFWRNSKHKTWMLVRIAGSSTTTHTSTIIK